MQPGFRPEPEIIELVGLRPPPFWVDVFADPAHLDQQINYVWFRPGPWLQISKTLVRLPVALSPKIVHEPRRDHFAPLSMKA